MHLLLADVAAMFGLEEKEMLVLMREQGLPARRIGSEYHFVKTEIDEWALQHRYALPPCYFRRELSGAVSLEVMLDRGGLFEAVPGATVTDVLRNAVLALPAFPGLDRVELINALVDRELMTPTAVGDGLAFPHPRSPIITDCECESLSIVRPVEPLEYGAFDGLPVHTLFIVLAANARRHLEVLARLAWLCRQKDFGLLLKERAPLELIRATMLSALARIATGSEE